MLQKEEIEIMAPVGSYESLHAAIQGGAGSVYFGIEQLNMRARSSNNFTKNDLTEIVSICKEHSVKTYLTVNVIIHDRDLALMREVVDVAKENNVTAIIASDISVIQYARAIGIEVHISTQLNITNIEAVKFYANFADVIVLARELNMSQVRDIYTQIIEQQIKGPNGNLVKIEMFVHGALCMAVSGKCYLSLHEQNYSANKGACLQTCRKAYIVTEKESGKELEIDNEYIMSPKDLCTIGFIDEVLQAGVSVLKIEGRARPAEYVKTVCQCYKEAINAVYDGTFSEEKTANWKTRLATVFNRGFWDGYYLGQKLGEWNKNYGSQATKIKIQIGLSRNYFPNIGIGEFQIQSGELNVGDEILITGPTTGLIEMTVTEIRVDLKSVQTAVKGDIFSMPVPEKVRRADKLFKWVDATSVKRQ